MVKGSVGPEAAGEQATTVGRAFQCADPCSEAKPLASRAMLSSCSFVY